MLSAVIAALTKSGESRAVVWSGRALDRRLVGSVTALVLGAGCVAGPLSAATTGPTRVFEGATLSTQRRETRWQPASATAPITATEQLWLTRAGILVGLTGVCIGGLGALTEPAAPGKRPEVSRHISLTVIFMMLGIALASGGAPGPDSVSSEKAVAPEPNDDPAELTPEAL